MDTNDIIRFVSDGFDKAKQGSALEVCQSVASFHDQNLLPAKSHYAFGWIIYYALHQSPTHAIRDRKLLLARYLKLNVIKPHKLHSMILTEAIRLAKDATELAENPSVRKGNSSTDKTQDFSIVRFTALWNLANLRPGDHKRKEHEGKILPSTVERLITQYTEELSYQNEVPGKEFFNLALQALADNPASDNLYAQVARLYNLKGNTEKAIEMMRKAVLLAPTKFYLWSRLADMIVDNPRLRVSLLYKALSTPGQEDFKGRIHLKLAQILVKAGSLQQAKWELDTVRELYVSKGWNMPRLYIELEQVIPAETLAVDPTPAYRKTTAMADDFIFDLLPEIPVSKTYHKTPDAATDRFGTRKTPRVAWRVTDSENRNYWFQPSSFGLHEDLPLNSKLIIKAFQGKVVKAYLPKP